MRYATILLYPEASSADERLDIDIGLSAISCHVVLIFLAFLPFQAGAFFFSIVLFSLSEGSPIDGGALWSIPAMNL